MIDNTPTAGSSEVQLVRPVINVTADSLGCCRVESKSAMPADWVCWLAGRQAGRQACRQAGRQAVRQTGMHKYLDS